MQLHFLGAAQEVTGSMHLIEINGKRILLDCGIYQGKRALSYERNLNFPFEAAAIDALVLSHAHIDHSGNIPNLVKQGFTGNIWCTAGTRNLSTYMLMDSGGIHEQDAAYVNKARARRNEPPIEPIYTRADAQRSLGQFIAVGFDRPVHVTDGVEVTFHQVGHILGAAWISVELNEFDTGKSWRMVFSGDVGRTQSMLLPPPTRPDVADILLLESTYGDRLHESMDASRRALRNVVNATARRRGKVIIPSFAVGRTQELVYALNKLDESGDIPVLPIFVDSPLAVEATDVFRMHPEAWNEEVQAFVVEDRKRNPFDDANIEYVRDVRRSKQLNHFNQPCVIISASGMAESGRILHHLKNNIGDADNTVLIVSFQAQNTLGRRLKDDEKKVRIFGEEYRVKAHVESIEGYSAHADQAELVAWAGELDRARLQRTFLVHGEPPAQEVLASKLRAAGLGQVEIPARGDVVHF
jgi:metallo-beta-lactamase family protein